MANAANILFFGSDEFSLKCYLSLRQHLPNAMVDIFTSPGSYLSRKVTELSEANCIYQMDSRSLKDATLPEPFSYEFGFVASFGKFIPRRIINAFKHMLNVHPSLLPINRGPAPIQYALLKGDRYSGVSIIDIHPTTIDGGDIYRQECVPITDEDTFLSLSDRLAFIGGKLLADIYTNIDRCDKQPQDQNNITVTRKIHKNNSIIRLGEVSALEIWNLFRAIGHQYPLQVVQPPLRIILLNVKIGLVPLNFDKEKWTTLSATAVPGTVFYERPTKALWMKAKDGWICCSVFHMNTSPIRYDGGQVMSALHRKSFDVVFVHE